MKITLTALSLMLVLGSMSGAQAATFKTMPEHPTNRVNTHMGTLDVNKDVVNDNHFEAIPQGKMSSKDALSEESRCSISNPGC
jgi:hypothetical protein